MWRRKSDVAYLIISLTGIYVDNVEYNDSKSQTKSISIGAYPKVLSWDLYFSLYTLMIYLGSVVSSVC